MGTQLIILTLVGQEKESNIYLNFLIQPVPLGHQIIGKAKFLFFKSSLANQ